MSYFLFLCLSINNPIITNKAVHRKATMILCNIASGVHLVVYRKLGHTSFIIPIAIPKACPITSKVPNKNVDLYLLIKFMLNIITNKIMLGYQAKWVKAFLIKILHTNFIYTR